MAKKHFIVLGRAGITYFSWLFVVLFLSLIFAYEGTKTINWPAICIASLFLLLVIYTFLTSYWDSGAFKLPFKAKVNISFAPQMIWQWHYLCIYEIKITELEKYYLLRITKNY
ncbi:acyltransferase [Lactobacillus sp. ESL0785]|uniref:acyltransferase n=1 Tax=Lactobacillus sp. ESL0785 TaxID=2983232 RepID=UPI0023F7FBB9|nr:acyltransferase [Lactobacillus sp. ESL0785]WEV70167.1 acyltransferase [Lactobacillus sp. ESL0785]